MNAYQLGSSEHISGARCVAGFAVGCPKRLQIVVSTIAAMIVFLISSVRCARYATAGLVLLLFMTASAQALTLRLDTKLTQPVAAEVPAATELLIRFGTSDLRRRAALHRHEALSVQRENTMLAAQISGNEELVARMKGLSSVQERTLDVLKSTLVLQEATRMSAPVPPVPPVASMHAQSSALAPAVPVLRSRLTASADGAAVSSPVLVIAGLELPHWLLGGAIGVLVTVLLGWLWVSVVAGRNRPASMPVADASTRPVGSADRRTDAEVLSELWGNDEDVADASLHDSVETITTKPPRATQPARNAIAAARPGAVDDGAAAARGSDTVVEDIDDAQPAKVEEVDWTRTVVSRKAADPQALKEVDTLIAFEQFEKAKALLDQMLNKEPDNPEYMLRHYHVRTHGGTDTSTDDAELLRAMMDGPMSDTMLRVRDIGRGLMPGDPLFADNKQRDEAVQLLKGVRNAQTGTAPAKT